MRARRLVLGLVAVASAGLLACVLLADEPEAGRRYALVVGVQNYEGAGLGSLRYCDNDAAGLADVLTRRGYRVTLMTRPEWRAKDRDDLLPTADNIRDNLKAILRNRKPADTVLLALSGHGEQLKRGGKMYFCAAKCNLDRPETLVSLDEVYALLKESPAGGKVLIVDACRNDPLAGKTGGSEKLESVTRPELPDPPGGTVALFSCSKGEMAYESDNLKHGYLFHFVIEGLEGKAAGKGGRIKWTDLTKHVDDELSDAVLQELGSKAVQTPEVRGESHGLVLAQVDAGSGPPNTSATESGEKTEVLEYTVEGQTKKGARRVRTLDLSGIVPPDGVTWEPNVEYANPDGQRLLLDLARPARGDGPFPAVLCIHGGGFRAGDRHGYDSLCLRLAQQGYVAATVEYRLAPKYQFPAAVYDCKAAVRWLRANAAQYHIDPERVGVTGGSAGGHLAQFLGVTSEVKAFEGDDGNPGQSSKVACVVNYYGPSDFTRFYGHSKDAAEVLPLWLGGDLDTAHRRHIEASPLYWVTHGAAPTLYVHGTKDEYVAYEQATWMVDKLKAADVEAELLTLEGAGHGFHGADADKAEQAMMAFFDRHLKAEKK